MADETFINGEGTDIVVEDQTEEKFFDDPYQGEHEARVSDLTKKLQSLEFEKLELINENARTKGKIEGLRAEIEELRKEDDSRNEKLREMEEEIVRSQEAKRALDAIAARALELETEVSRLQHDLVSAMSEGEEANREVVELKRELGEKGVRVEGLEGEVGSLRYEKVEIEKKVRELERKVGVLEVREVEERSKRLRVEEEMRGKIDEKEKEINGFRKKVEELEASAENNGVELEKWAREKLGFEALLSEAEEKAKGMELKVVGLERELEKENRYVNGLRETVGSGGGEGGFKGLKLGWPVVAVGSTGAIAVAAVAVYLIYARRR